MKMKRILAVTAIAVATLTAGTSAVATSGQTLKGLTPEAEAFSKVDRNTQWQQVQKLKLDFPTFHPQGMSLVGDKIFLSSVEIIEPTVRYPSPVDGYDRSTGKGRGHVFVIDRQGKLLKDIVVGEDTVYHPGGTDFDGSKLWVPVAEYRPNSRSIVYTVDPDTYEVKEEFRQSDHVGGVVADRKTNRISGVSWGSRKLFTWNGEGRLLGTQANPSHFIDYQDCEYAGVGHQLCSGVTNLKTADGKPFQLGGLALTDLATADIVHEVPSQLFSTAGHSMTRNPVALESDGDVLRMFAAPDDGEEVAGTELFVFEARP
ncbi:DUF6454 family protein [Pseudarthrobacter sp. NPDC092424]|uniref:DUF6454 family protein n=1 Tax=Pseudarthrobacter sp. NPDC092424 TaxID=3364415 RepID=UPI0038303CAC